MAQVETIQVYWQGKFGGKAVTINAADFNPKLHKRLSDKEEAKANADEDTEDSKNKAKK